MPQGRADGWQRHTLPKEMHGEGMAECVSSKRRKRQAAESDTAFEDVMHRCCGEWSRWRSAAQEELPVGAARAPGAQVSCQHGAAFLRERQHQGLLGLRLPDCQSAGPPVD